MTCFRSFAPTLVKLDLKFGYSNPVRSGKLSCKLIFKCMPNCKCKLLGLLSKLYAKIRRDGGGSMWKNEKPMGSLEVYLLIPLALHWWVWQPHFGSTHSCKTCVWKTVPCMADNRVRQSKAIAHIVPLFRLLIFCHFWSMLDPLLNSLFCAKFSWSISKLTCY